MSEQPPRLGRSVRRPVGTAGSQLVRFAPLADGQALPTGTYPADGPVDLPAWVAAHRQLVEQELWRCGAILFRGFGIDDAAGLAAATSAVAGDPLAYQDRSSPRSQVAGHVYTSTDHPPEYQIFLHNEQSYSDDWPARIAFCCALPAATGGQTPLADCRRVYQRVDPAVRARFEHLGVRYFRRYGSGFGLDWQTAFQTDDRAEVERACRERGMRWQWSAGGRQLSTSHVRPAVLAHPVTGELVWFNHATFFHVSTLDESIRRVLTDGLGVESLPYQTYYGDGSPIEPAVLAALRAAYQAETVTFDWQQGDLLLVDNMLTAHGRAPYTGARRVLVAMADPVSWAGLAATGGGARP